MSRPASVVNRLDEVRSTVEDAADRIPLVTDGTALAVVVVALLALLFRLLFLGSRVAHYDEGRVAYWILEYMETGQFSYSFIIHGPFVQHVNRIVFSVIGANDFSMRLVVAVIGALLPLGVLLLREHLRDAEVITATLFLSFNPVIFYYSRFFRSTIPVVAFSFVAFGLLVRLYDTRRLRYVHGAVFFVALAFTAKENALIYVLVWLGASVLLLDHELFRPRSARTGVAWLAGWWERNVRGRSLRRHIPLYLGHVVVAVLLFCAVVLFFYAPRQPSSEAVGLWEAFGDPGRFPALIDATVDDIWAGLEYWFGGASESGRNYASVFGRYVHFAGDFMRTLAFYAAPLVAFALIGTVGERYATSRRRNLVMFTAYWGFVSVVGYPLGADIAAGWITVNALVPLAIPASVGVALLYRWGRDAVADRDKVSAGIVAALLILVSIQVGLTTLNTSYTNPQSNDNGLVQFAQPMSDLRPVLRDIKRLAAKHDGTDVLFYGESFVVRVPRGMEPACTRIQNTLPLQWYLKRYEAEGACARTEAKLESVLSRTDPPVVIAPARLDAVVAQRLPGYEARRYYLRTKGGNTTFFVDTERLPDTPR